MVLTGADGLHPQQQRAEAGGPRVGGVPGPLRDKGPDRDERRDGHISGLAAGLLPEPGEARQSSGGAWSSLLPPGPHRQGQLSGNIRTSHLAASHHQSRFVPFSLKLST